ncbi:hypothetical protein NXY17_06170 [Bacteroides fragilis]|nr:hypothetical protein [Bacteroides fragilis]
MRLSLTSADLSSVRTGMYQMELKEHPTLRTIMVPVCFITVRYDGEDMQTEKSGSRSQLCYDMTYSTADNAPSIWQTPYIVIGRANRMIEAPESGKLTDKEEAATESTGPICSRSKGCSGLWLILIWYEYYGKTYTAPDAPNSLGIPVVPQFRLR